MTFDKISNVLAAGVLTIVASCVLCPDVFAQGPALEVPGALISSAQATSPERIDYRKLEETHRFWDKRNFVLFSAAAAVNAADFVVTRSNLQSGGQELNPIVRVFGRSTAGLALNFAGETAGVISFSYFFHKTGHHKLERVVSFVNIGGSAGAVAYGLSHR